MIKIDNIPLNDPKVWQLLASGRVCGIFQLEQGAGRTNVKKMKPESIDDLAALLSAIRPGCSDAKDSNGVSMTEHLIRRKNKLEDVSFYHESLKPILEKTYGIILYQESIMQIGRELAGFDDNEVEDFRKAPAKKSAEKMAKVSKLFIERATKKGVVTKEQAEQIMEWIKASARYSFCKCVSKNTKLRQGSKGKNKYHWTVEEAYKIRNNISFPESQKHKSLYKKWKTLGYYGQGWSLNKDYRLRPNKIIDIQPSGVQELFRVTLDNGAFIDVTKNHKFPTENGEMPLIDIKVGDKLYYCLEFNYQDRKNYAFSNFTRQDLQNRAKGKVNKAFGSDNWYYTNGSYKDFEQSKKQLPNHCQCCKKKNCRIETHHINGDRTNSKIENLENLCSSCHKKKEYAAGRTTRGKKGLSSTLIQIKSIESIGFDETYSVTMDAPYHTFVTDQNIVTSNSHAYEYAVTCYLSSWIKANYTLEFFKTWLETAHLKKTKAIEDIQNLCSDIKYFNIDVLPPCIINSDYHFKILGNSVMFGLSDIKGIGNGNVDKIKNVIKDAEIFYGKSINEITWYEFITFSISINGFSASLAQKFIEAGAFSKFGDSRKRMLYETTLLDRLSPGEKKWILSRIFDYNNLVGLVKASARTKKEGGAAHSVKRVPEIESIVRSLEHPPYSLDDTIDEIVKNEENLLGVAITCSRLDKLNEVVPNTTIKEIQQGKSTDDMYLAVELKSYRVVTCKRGKSAGQEMAFAILADQTGSEDCVIFPAMLFALQDQSLWYEGAKLFVHVKRDLKQGSMLLENFKPLIPTSNQSL